MQRDKISIIMGIYNCASTLPDAINSVLNQTYTNWELILCDDCSTDNTYQVAQSFVDQYPDKIILVKNEKNSKLASSLNHCLSCATGEFVARMDGDDLSKPERLERQLAYLKSHPEYDLVGTAMQRFNETGLHDVCYSVDSPDRYTLRKRIPFHHATILTYKRVYDVLGGYTVAERTNRGQDYDLWFRFFHAGFSGNNLKEALYLVREDAGAIRRRTPEVRRLAFETTKYGFALLEYPKWWIVRPYLSMKLKSITPYVVVDYYRKWQAKRGA